MKLDVIAYPMERTPSEDFFSLAFPLLTPPDEAQEGDVLGIAMPMMLCPERNVVFDHKFPIPEVVISRNGYVALASDEEVPARIQAGISQLLHRGRKDVSFMTCAHHAASRLAEHIPDDGQHAGILAWQFRGFTIARCWSHILPLAQVIHMHDPEDHDEISKVMTRVNLLLSRTSFSRASLLTNRGL